MFSVTFDFKCKYIKEVQYNCSAHHFVHLFIIARSSHSHKEQKESQFFFQFFSSIQTEYEKILIWRDTCILSECRKKACTFVEKRLQHRCLPVNIAKFLRIAFSAERQRLFLTPEVYLEQSNIYKGAFLEKQLRPISH